jgi:hypothetical protein
VSARANQLLEAGLWLKMSGDLDGARRLFEQALKLDPDSIRARELLGQSVPEAEAVPQELRDVPVTRTDLFAVPLPRLFQDEPAAPAAIPEEWWNAPPSDAMGNTSRFFIRTGERAAADAPRSSHTLPWGPSPLPPRGAGTSPAEVPATVVVPPPPGSTGGARRGGLAGAGDFEGEDFGVTPGPGTFTGELMEATPAREPGRAGATPSRTTGAIPLPPALAPDARPPTAMPGPPPAASRTGGAVPLPPAAGPGATSPLPAAPPTLEPERTPAAGTAPGRTSGPVPLPPAVSPLHPPATATPSWPIPSQEPVPWPMSPSKGSGPVPLPSGTSGLAPPRGPPAPLQPPPAAPAASFTTVPPPRSAGPSDAWGGEGEGPTLLAPEGAADALELLAEPRGVTGLTPLPALRDPQADAVRLFERARQLQKMDDHSGARELLLQAQQLFPELTGLAEALARSETKLQTIYESKIGKLSAVPRVRLKEDEVIWLNLDHRAGFMLAQIDGMLSFEDLFSVSGMSRLDTARILAQLLDQRVIVS